ncbi:hypothetical protein HJC23_006065 [Cyclotella cryptica]|uniref:Uncharacterized protein n=1 Tax=Cyclotella cryptica TaxID=29204 RepID=A0ABD3PUF7_9STRA|eukprot:CCRYP_011386-RA/>CCRYP_011386-RA protein AED:0.00 eAED:0.00 QI:570/-1/1/1/-1/1/1/910/473
MNTRSSGSRCRFNLLTLLVLIATTSVSFLTFSSYKIDIIHEKVQYTNPNINWSKRKILSERSKVVQLSQEADIFLRTGKLTDIASKGIPHGSSNTSAPGGMLIEARTVKGGRAHKSSHPAISLNHKRNRLLHGTSLSLAEMNGWPPLRDLIASDGDITIYEDISWLLDFAIIGFAKTGTTSILRHLSDLAHLLPSESCDLVVNGTAKLVRDMYKDRNTRLDKAERNGDIFEERLRGLKCPQDVSSEFSMHNYAKYFPNTKLIIGVRHPVSWFESLYNFRVSNVPWKKMLHTSKLTRGCPFGSQGVCAHRANFADFLSQLGKTPMSSTSELRLLTLGLSPVETPVGKVFLYDVSQLSESDDGGIRSTQFRKDLKDFLGLTADIPPFPAVDTSGKFDFLAPIRKQTEKDKIDICTSEHTKIRAVLMEKARRSSEWIRNFFLQSNDVFVSSRDHFLELLDKWNVDPCQSRKRSSES